MIHAWIFLPENFNFKSGSLLMKQLLILIFLIASLMRLNAQPMEGDSCTDLSALDFHLQMKASELPVLIDTRTPGEFRRERIPGAVLAENRGKLMLLTDSLDLDHPLFIYCDIGDRSSVACRLLAEKGHTHVYNLLGGIREWKHSSLEVDTKKPDKND
jgi:rhodanese-related sulfurtransferase